MRSGGVWRYAWNSLPVLLRASGTALLAVLGPASDAAAQRDEAVREWLTRLRTTGLPLDWTAKLRRSRGRLGAAAILAGHRPAGGTPARSSCMRRRWRRHDAAWPAPVVAVAHSCVGDVVARGARWRAAAAELAWRTAAICRRGLRARRCRAARRASSLPTRWQRFTGYSRSCTWSLTAYARPIGTAHGAAARADRGPALG